MTHKNPFKCGALALVVSLTCGPIQALAQTTNVWLTTDDQKTDMQQQSSIAFSGGNDSTTNTIFVDETQLYQQIDGFGASFTDSAAYLLNQVATASSRQSAMNNLFTRDGSGIGVSFVRNPMGASDLARNVYSYDDLPAGQTDPNLNSFSIAHDQADIFPLVLQARQLNPQLKIMANPWSPPGWMKNSGSMIGGSLLSNMYSAFANYFVKYIQTYQTAGIPIDYVFLQNEPLYLPPDYPGMSMDAAAQTTVLRDYILPAFAANNIATKVLVYDHNWDRPDYPGAVLADPAVLASSQVAGIAWHGYGGTPGVMASLHNKYPTKDNFETEHSGGTFVSDQVKADFEEITQAMRSWSRSYVKWSVALDENRGPHTGGCGTCNPLVTINTTTGIASYNIDYYTLGHFSKFVLPAAHRIYSSNAAGFVSAAFKNPDGSKVLVVYNDTNSARTAQVVWGSQSFTYPLQGLSGATFTWSGTQNGGYSVRAATQQIQASSFNDMFGLETEATTDTDGGYDLGYADNGDWAVYKNIDFGFGAASVNVRVASAGTGGTLEFHLNGTTGPLIGSATVPVTGGWQTWQMVSTSILGAAGINDLYIVFKGTTNIGNVNWFQFQPSQTQASTVQFSSPADSVDQASLSKNITVTRSGDTTIAVTVDFATSDGTAQQTRNYTTATGTLNFAAGQTMQTFPVLVTNNAYVTPPTTVNLTLSNPTGGATLGPQSTAVLTIVDSNTVDPPTTQPADDPGFFVRQQYADFLSRAPDTDGFNFWTNSITQCGNDLVCVHNRRVAVADAFFFEPEFQDTGTYVYRIYKASFSGRPAYAEFIADRARVVGSSTLAAGKTAFAKAFAERPAFAAIFPLTLSGTDYVQALVSSIKTNTRVDLSVEEPALIGQYNAGNNQSESRGLVLEAIANDQSFIDAEYNESFVVAEYFGYLRRDPDTGGFDFWIGQMKRFPLRDVGIQQAMACSFITSLEYQARFSSVMTHGNRECPQ